MSYEMVLRHLEHGGCLTISGGLIKLRDASGGYLRSVHRPTYDALRIRGLVVGFSQDRHELKLVPPEQRHVFARLPEPLHSAVREVALYTAEQPYRPDPDGSRPEGDEWMLALRRLAGLGLIARVSAKGEPVAYVLSYLAQEKPA